MVTDETIREITRRLSRAAPDATIILFGSRARGDAREDSDIDILVVEPGVESPYAEEVRLRDAIRGLGVFTDIIVVPAEIYSEWCDEPGTVIREAAHDGVALYAPA
jgi:uncharacterized protein